MTVVLRSRAESGNFDAIVESLASAWNTSNAIAFAGLFSEDADLVNIHGMHIHGRQAIAGLYEMLFRSVFAGSTIMCSINQHRMLRPQVGLIHIKVAVDVPGGRMAGTHNVVTSAVVTRDHSDWRVASLHNTLVSVPA